MKKLIIMALCIASLAGCSSISDDVLDGNISASDPSVSDEALCLAAFTSEVKMPKSKIQQNILNEIVKRKISPAECSSYFVSAVGGADYFCDSLNKTYARGNSSDMVSFGNYISLSDMFLVQEELNLECNTKQYLKRTQYQATSRPVDFSSYWKTYQPKTNTINCISLGSSKTCNDSQGNIMNINNW